MARTVTPRPESCRGCWRNDQREVFRLRCGHVFCAACLASRARAASNAAASLLPLRCCEVPVPAAVLASVLHASELAFYGLLTAREVERKKQLVPTVTLHTECDFCGRATTLAVAAERERLLSCGHVYCDDCRAGLREATKHGEPLCCQEMPRAAAVAPMAPMPVVVNPSPAASSAAAAPATDASAKAKSKSKGKGKAKRKANPSTALAVAVALDDTAAANNVCIDCAAVVANVEAVVRAPCGHAFCRVCLKQRCQRAVQDDAHAVRCCNQAVPVELVRPALGVRLLFKYEALVAKQASVVAAVTPAIQAHAAKRKTAAPTTTTATPPPPSKRLRTEPADKTKTECVSCLTDMATATASDRLTGPCGHVYCVKCLTTMARLSLEDRSLVPIRCCGQEFPIDYVRRLLPKTKMAQYERFLAEKDWRQSDLKSDHEYAKIVKKVRGKQCPACGIGVQKRSGCSWMYCPHGHTFCWTCAAYPCVCGATGTA